MAVTEQRYYTGLDLYAQVLRNFPKSENAYKALFMLGYVNSEFLHRPTVARDYFKKVLEKYPGCDLADDAVYLLDNQSGLARPLPNPTTP